MKKIQWVHYTKTCSSSAHGPYLSAETYRPIKGYLTWDLLEHDCESWFENVNDDHEVGHGGNCKFVVVDAPPKEWLDAEIERNEKQVSSKTEFIKLLKKTAQ